MDTVPEPPQRRPDRENRLLRNIIRDVASAPSVEDALAVALRLVCASTGWCYAEAWMPTGEARDLVRVAFHAETGASVEAFARESAPFTFSPGEGLPGRCFVEGRRILLDDLHRDPLAPFLRAEAARRAGLHTFLAVPVKEDADSTAVLVFAADRARGADSDAVDLIETVAVQVGLLARQVRDRRALAVEAARQRVLHAILALSLVDLPDDVALGRALDEILSLPGLALQPRGCVFLAGEDGDTLTMVAQRNLPASIQETCQRVALGTCVCGRAARMPRMAFVADTGQEADHPADAPSHGHYCLPLRSEGRLLGLVNLYVGAGHRRDVGEEAILDAAAQALIGMILRRRLARDLAISRAHFTRLVEHDGNGVVILDTAGRIAFANPRAEAWFGTPAGGSVGHTLETYLVFRGGEAVREVHGGPPVLLRVDSSAIAWRSAPARLLILRDITAERTLEKVRHTVVGAHYPDIARDVIVRGTSRYTPREQAITALFIDVRGSTNLGAVRGPSHLGQVLSHFYELAIGAVEASGGGLNKFIGDAVLATFNAPVPHEDHTLAAVRAADVFLDGLIRHNAARPDLAFHVRIGVESGPALVGDMGPEHRHEYNVAGPCLSLAARLTKLPTEDRVVLGPAAAAVVAGRVAVARRDRVVLDGFGNSMEVAVLERGRATGAGSG